MASALGLLALTLDHDSHMIDLNDHLKAIFESITKAFAEKGLPGYSHRREFAVDHVLAHRQEGDRVTCHVTTTGHFAKHLGRNFVSLIVLDGSPRPMLLCVIYTPGVQSAAARSLQRDLRSLTDDMKLRLAQSSESDLLSKCRDISQKKLSFLLLTGFPNLTYVERALVHYHKPFLDAHIEKSGPVGFGKRELKMIYAPETTEGGTESGPSTGPNTCSEPTDENAGSSGCWNSLKTDWISTLLPSSIWPETSMSSTENTNKT